MPGVHVEQELLIYEAFGHDSQLGQNNLKVRFKKVPHNINFREKKPKPSKKKPEAAGSEEPGGPRGRVARFRYFEDIYGYSGVSGGTGTPKTHGDTQKHLGTPKSHPKTHIPPLNPASGPPKITLQPQITSQSLPKLSNSTPKKPRFLTPQTHKYTPK
ncbi:hypothetical protein AV530_008863 [Patagioenas fasciata monilis]|uniref:Uncharacterized protein n=1 Tax=Patagioenas fasciata monilis TaxID=372326 RepID=A0A1V4JQ42_PATFA|nr:hypothetical protein AV530_008863 [Patagioenas fasciata monilis]